MPCKAAPWASTQTLLPLDDVIGDVVRLRGGDFRAIVEAIPVNYALKAAEEQEAILAGYRRWLNGLSYPVQILVRVVPTDVDRYLDGFVDDSIQVGDEWSLSPVITGDHDNDGLWTEITPRPASRSCSAVCGKSRQLMRAPARR